MSTVPMTSLLLAGLLAMGAGRAAVQPSADGLHARLDSLLDLYVRDGLVYYRALRSDRARLDQYAGSLSVSEATYHGWSREQKMAFWVNAYNAFVLRTVIDHYPIRGKSAAYPASSIRQISGAFERMKHRAASRSVTLDEIEKTILPEFKEPRLHLALGRGAVGSGRLRSEAYTGARLGQQLDAIQAEFVSQDAMLKIDRASGQVTVTPILSWHEAEFVAAYDKVDDKNAALFAQRSPIERALLAFITPHLLPLEHEFIRKNEFHVTYHALDWRLNDLTGGRGD